MKACEMSLWTGPTPCGARASWLVSVGARRSDAQLSCGRHLNRTCDVLLGAENRAGASLTVAPVEASELSLLRQP